jgi:hypothetical protein
VQAITFKVEGDREEALKELKRVKTFLEGKGVETRVYWSIEAGTASPNQATVVHEFPSAAAWGALADSEEPEMIDMRIRGLQSHAILSTSLLQEVPL